VDDQQVARVQREREVKLDCPAGFALPDLSLLGTVHAEDPLSLNATYYDTAELRLARWGVTLRRRTGGVDDGWTLKLPDEGARTEVTLQLSAGTTPPAELKALATAFTRGAPLRKVVTLLTRRSPVRVLGLGGVPLAEVVVDQVTGSSPIRGPSAWWELEVEALAPEVSLEPFTAVLLAAGAHDRAQTSKAIRALGPTATLPGDPPPADPMRLGDPARLLAEHALRTHTRSLVLQDSRVRLDLEDSVHQMRVAARRLRSALRTLHPLLVETWADEVRGELKWLGGALGAARDAEVGLALVGEVLVEVGAPYRLRKLVAQEYALEDTHAAAVQVLANRRWTRLLDRLVEAAYEPPVTPLASEPLREMAPDLVGRSWDHLAKKADALQSHRSPATDYHRVRVLAKRARYAMETVAPAYGKPASRFAAKVSKVQDVLGDHQDCVVATDVLHRIARKEALGQEHAFVLGQAVRVLVDRELLLREEFHELWPEVRRHRHRRWLRG
jgi:CHAD domain-containing protein